MCHAFSLVPNTGQNYEAENIIEHFRIQTIYMDEKGKKGLVRSNDFKFINMNCLLYNW